MSIPPDRVLARAQGGSPSSKGPLWLNRVRSASGKLPPPLPSVECCPAVTAMRSRSRCRGRVALSCQVAPQGGVAQRR